MSALYVEEPKQLECRIVIIRHPRARLRILSDNCQLNVEIGMYDPANMRYEFLGKHREEEVDRVVHGLKRSIEQAGHRLTFCERSA